MRTILLSSGGPQDIASLAAGPVAATPSGTAAFSLIDALIIQRAWDAELIIRERESPNYEILPAEPRDAEIVAEAGGSLVRAFIDPVVIYQNSPDA